MKSITTLEEAQSLEERTQFSFIDADGKRTVIPTFRDIVAVSLEENTILTFFDKDGREMGIGYDVYGAYKYVL